MKKVILSLLLSVFLLLGAGVFFGTRYINNVWFQERPNYLSWEGEMGETPFTWVVGEYEDHTEPHDAMNVPVRIPGLPYKFVMQFDTGSPYSMLNRKPLEALQAKGLDYEEFTDEKLPYIRDFRFSVGENEMLASQMRVAHNGSEVDWDDTTQVIRLGTIGSDFLADKVVAINFAEQFIQVFPERTAKMDTELAFKSFDFKGRRLMLPASIEGKEMELFFDTGCSSFGLITSKPQFDAYTDPATPIVHYEANSFGEAIPLYHRASTTPVKMGGGEVPLRRISYVKWHDEWQGFLSRFTSIGGWLGNKPFLQSTLILDTKAEEFAVAVPRRF